MANIFLRTVKKPKTTEEYLQIFEDLMQRFESVSDKADLFKRIINALELHHLFLSDAKKSTASAYCGLIKERIKRKLTQSECIKIEIMSTAYKNKYVNQPARKGRVGTVWATRSTLRTKSTLRREIHSKGHEQVVRVMRKNAIRKKR